VYFEYICWKFAGSLLDRVNTPLLIVSGCTWWCGVDRPRRRRRSSKVRRLAWNISRTV